MFELSPTRRGPNPRADAVARKGDEELREAGVTVVREPKGGATPLGEQEQEPSSPGPTPLDELTIFKQ